MGLLALNETTTSSRSNLNHLLSHTFEDYSSYTGSNTTGTSIGSTVQGIGSLTGKAIKALGNVTLRGLDRVIIYACIRAILSKFPHSDTQATTIEGIQEMYDIILELSRPKLYSKSLRRTALTLLLTQINNGHTHELEQALDRWNSVELEIFLHGLVLQSAALNPNSSIENTPLRSPVILDSRKMIVLMCRIAQRSTPGCQVVLGVGLFRLFGSIDEARFSGPDLAEIYRTILYIFIKSPPQFHASTEEATIHLVNSIALSKPSFVKTLALWDAKDLKALVNGILWLERSVPPTGLSFVVLDDTLPSARLNKASNSTCGVGVLCSTLALLYRIGKASGPANQITVRAGILGIILRLEALEYPVQLFGDGFRVVFDVFRHPLSNFIGSLEEQNQTIDVLLFQIVNDSKYLLNLLEDWCPREIEELLRTLVEKLRTTVASNSSGKYSNVMDPLVSFIALNALSDHQICEVIIGTGFLNILCSIKVENEDVRSLIIDILQQEKHSSLVKQAAEQFISYQIASGCGDSWPYQPGGSSTGELAGP